MSLLSFSHLDTNLIIASYLSKNDVVSLIKTNKNLHTDLFYLPYKIFRFNWYSDTDTLKTFVIHAKGIEELIIDNYEFFQYIKVNLPRLKKITIKNCNLSNLKLLDLYSQTITEIIIDNCIINDTNFDLKKYPSIRKITIDPNRLEITNINCSRESIITLQTKSIDCCIIKVG